MEARIRKAKRLNVKENMKLKILTPKQMLQILPVAFAKVDTGNTSENLLNEIRKVIYSLHRVKELLKG